ncbi:hypothetical protein Mal15_42230 [Stieleria maiorica]|uniref:Uncharacterized protein n=1 Tax=Stieleria maiorica TaxID=2795974 RepID=A0A5B9MGY3_9BACT|nr:hypothetical protein Mal15_42230 [Stieleria maiorica]
MTARSKCLLPMGRVELVVCGKKHDAQNKNGFKECLMICFSGPTFN